MRPLLAHPAGGEGARRNLRGGLERGADVLVAPMALCREFVPHMRTAGGGQIFQISTQGGQVSFAGLGAYHASKWGLLGFSHALHTEARPAGVKVTAVIAGGMRTPFLLERFPDIDVSTLQDPARVAETVRFVLLQPAESVIPEVMVLPMGETSWP